MNTINIITVAAVAGLVSLTAVGFGIGKEVKEPGSTPFASLVKSGSPAASEYSLTAKCVEQVKARLTSPKSFTIDGSSMEKRPATVLQIMGLDVKDVPAFEVNANILTASTPEHAEQLKHGDLAFLVVSNQIDMLRMAGIDRSKVSLNDVLPPEHPANNNYYIATIAIEGSASNGFGVALPLHATCDTLVSYGKPALFGPTVTIN